jgi:hypothetical protein
MSVFMAVQTIEKIAFEMADDEDTDWSLDRTAKRKQFAEAVVQAALVEPAPPVTRVPQRTR